MSVCLLIHFLHVVFSTVFICLIITIVVCLVSSRGSLTFHLIESNTISRINSRRGRGPSSHGSPQLHPAVDQCQRDEVHLAFLAVVEQDAVHLGRPELHGDADCVVGAHGLEGQVGLAPKRWDEVFDRCGGMKTKGQSCQYYVTHFIWCNRRLMCIIN